MLGVILAAGRGSRMGNLTENMPKPMLNVWGKPWLEHIIAQMKDGGIHKIILIVGYKKEEIIAYFNDGSAFDIPITYVEQQGLKGQAEALAAAAPLITDELFIVQMGDILIPANYYRLLWLKVKFENAGIITVNSGDWRTGAGVLLDTNQNVLDIVEKPSSEYNFEWNNSGIMLLTQRVISALPKTFADGQEVYLTQILKKCLSAGIGLTCTEIDNKDYFDLKDLNAYRKYNASEPPKFLQKI